MAYGEKKGQFSHVSAFNTDHEHIHSTQAGEDILAVLDASRSFDWRAAEPDVCTKENDPARVVHPQTEKMKASPKCQ